MDRARKKVDRNHVREGRGKKVRVDRTRERGEREILDRAREREEGGEGESEQNTGESG